MARGELTRLSGGSGEPTCEDDDCPNVYRHHVRQSIIVQGSVYDGFAVPAGEALVEIPETVLKEAVRALGW
jgi:protocatechuate 3,4-dioxygenase beta subunit